MNMRYRIDVMKKKNPKYKELSSVNSQELILGLVPQEIGLP